MCVQVWVSTRYMLKLCLSLLCCLILLVPLTTNLQHHWYEQTLRSVGHCILLVAFVTDLHALFIVFYHLSTRCRLSSCTDKHASSVQAAWQWHAFTRPCLKSAVV